MTDYLEFHVDKFTFLIANDRLYSREGMWVKIEGQLATIGISDYLQQRSGDMAFIEVKPAGTLVQAGEELVVIETIKVNISLTSPVKGRVKLVNPEMETSPEIVNQDPYGNGWVAVLELDEKTLLVNLLEADAYYSIVKVEAEQEAKK
jgi:glycine cleavage system H protein